MTVNFTKMEQEIIILKAILEMIDEMVNYSTFVKLSGTKDVELRFNTPTEQRLFNILLVDFLSQHKNLPFGLMPSPPQAPESERSILFHLNTVCNEPKLNPIGSTLLKEPFNAFLQWLEKECFVEKVWLPSVNIQTDMRIKRISFIKICGNIAKHSFMRLSANAVAIQGILKKNGHLINEEQAYLVFSDFYDWFHNNIFNYHSSAIAEFLNNIRWGIYRYLQPEFQRSFIKDAPPSPGYSYKYPPDCSNSVAQTIYWDLMNAVMSPPYIPQFEVTRYLKMRY